MRLEPNQFVNAVGSVSYVVLGATLGAVLAKIGFFSDNTLEGLFVEFGFVALVIVFAINLKIFHYSVIEDDTMSKIFSVLSFLVFQFSMLFTYLVSFRNNEADGGAFIRLIYENNEHIWSIFIFLMGWFILEFFLAKLELYLREL